MILALAMKLPSVANQRLHWATKAKQVKAQRKAVAMAWRCVPREQRQALAEWRHEGFRLAVTLSRVATRKLDDDNLASAFKAVRDQVAAELGIDDGGDAVAWRYTQTTPPRKHQPGVMIMIRPLEVLP